MRETVALDPVLRLTLCGALALLFLVAAIHKLRDLRGFRRAVREYALLPPSWLTWTPVAVAAVELTLAMGLVLPWAGPVPGLAGAAVLALYTSAIAINLYRGRRHIDCGCAGPAGSVPIGRGLVVRNAVLIAAALACTVPAAPRSLVWLDAVTVCGGIVALALLYAAADVGLANAARLQTLATDHSPHAETTEDLSWSKR